MPINSLFSLWSIEDLLNMSHVGNVPGVLGERAQWYRVLSEQDISYGPNKLTTFEANVHHLCYKIKFGPG